MESGDRYGVAGYGADGPVPPPPAHAPSVGPPPPGAALRAVGAALLNLTGLGLGYALLGRWVRAAGCWAATAVLLWVALPADPDGVPAGVLVGYLLVLVLAAADGARIARRSALGGAWRPVLAVGLGVVLLAVPHGRGGGARLRAGRGAGADAAGPAGGRGRAGRGGLAAAVRFGQGGVREGARRLSRARRRPSRLPGRQAGPGPPEDVLRRRLRPVREEAALRGRGAVDLSARAAGLGRREASRGPGRLAGRAPRRVAVRLRRLAPGRGGRGRHGAGRVAAYVPRFRVRAAGGAGAQPHGSRPR